MRTIHICDYKKSYVSWARQRGWHIWAEREALEWNTWSTWDDEFTYLWMRRTPSIKRSRIANDRVEKAWFVDLAISTLKAAFHFSSRNSHQPSRPPTKNFDGLISRTQLPVVEPARFAKERNIQLAAWELLSFSPATFMPRLWISPTISPMYIISRHL